MHENEKWKWSRSVVSNSSRPHGLQPTRLLHSWDFPGESTGVGCHRLLWFHVLADSNTPDVTFSDHHKNTNEVFFLILSVKKSSFECQGLPIKDIGEHVNWETSPYCVTQQVNMVKLGRVVYLCCVRKSEVSTCPQCGLYLLECLSITSTSHCVSTILSKQCMVYSLKYPYLIPGKFTVISQSLILRIPVCSLYMVFPIYSIA